MSKSTVWLINQEQIQWQEYMFLAALLLFIIEKFSNSSSLGESEETSDEGAAKLDV